jgi:hypothetical protein
MWRTARCPVDKSDPLNQSTVGDQVREQMAKHTLWLNADNFEEMWRASFEAYRASHPQTVRSPDSAEWEWVCAAALAVFEWRMGGRVRP